MYCDTVDTRTEFREIVSPISYRNIRPRVGARVTG